MAHRGNVTQVLESVEPSKGSEQVRDPVCGKVLSRGQAASLVFRSDQTLYFCSRECKERFVSRS